MSHITKKTYTVHPGAKSINSKKIYRHLYPYDRFIEANPKTLCENGIKLNDSSIGYFVGEYWKIIDNRLSDLYSFLANKLANKLWIKDEDNNEIRIPMPVHSRWKSKCQVICMDSTANLNPTFYTDEGFKIV